MMTTATLLLASGTYLHRGVINISIANLVIIIVMVVVFIAALVIPFPFSKGDTTDEADR